MESSRGRPFFLKYKPPELENQWNHKWLQEPIINRIEMNFLLAKGSQIDYIFGYEQVAHREARSNPLDALRGVVNAFGVAGVRRVAKHSGEASR